MGAGPSIDESRSGSGGLAAAGVLALAAAPSFTAMALWTAVHADPPGMICTSGQGAIDGMIVLYALMSVFHLSPWLRLLSASRRSKNTDGGRHCGK
jgi:hypothetical protein